MKRIIAGLVLGIAVSTLVVANAAVTAAPDAPESTQTPDVGVTYPEPVTDDLSVAESVVVTADVEPAPVPEPTPKPECVPDLSPGVGVTGDWCDELDVKGFTEHTILTFEVEGDVQLHTDLGVYDGTRTGATISFTIDPTVQVWFLK